MIVIDESDVNEFCRKTNEHTAEEQIHLARISGFLSERQFDDRIRIKQSSKLTVFLGTAKYFEQGDNAIQLTGLDNRFNEDSNTCKDSLAEDT